eukprot:11190171-Lingulodinium_polyedra.AAC.1
MIGRSGARRDVSRLPGQVWARFAEQQRRAVSVLSSWGGVRNSLNSWGRAVSAGFGGAASGGGGLH